MLLDFSFPFPSLAPIRQQVDFDITEMESTLNFTLSKRIPLGLNSTHGRHNSLTKENSSTLNIDLLLYILYCCISNGIPNRKILIIYISLFHGYKEVLYPVSESSYRLFQ